MYDNKNNNNNNQEINLNRKRQICDGTENSQYNNTDSYCLDVTKPPLHTHKTSQPESIKRRRIEKTSCKPSPMPHKLKISKKRIHSPSIRKFKQASKKKKLDRPLFKQRRSAFKMKTCDFIRKSDQKRKIKKSFLKKLKPLNKSGQKKRKHSNTMHRSISPCAPKPRILSISKFMRCPPKPSNAPVMKRKRPKFSSQSPKRPKCSSQSPKRPKCSSQSPKRPKFSSQSPKRPKCSSQSPKRPKCSSQSPKRPKFSSQSPKRRKFSSKSPKRPKCSSQSPKRPKFSSQSPKRRKFSSKSPKLPKFSLSSPSSRSSCSMSSVKQRNNQRMSRKRLKSKKSPSSPFKRLSPKKPHSPVLCKRSNNSPAVAKLWSSRLRPRPLKSARFTCYRPVCLNRIHANPYDNYTNKQTPIKQTVVKDKLKGGKKSEKSGGMKSHHRRRRSRSSSSRRSSSISNSSKNMFISCSNINNNESSNVGQMIIENVENDTETDIWYDAMETNNLNDTNHSNVECSMDKQLKLDNTLSGYASGGGGNSSNNNDNTDNDNSNNSIYVSQSVAQFMDQL
uniref:Uncharacterized protein n=1 Tax=Trichobilharzia regenti TaxID=157069 RepID=A0AA85J5P2_TRIRE|nr:unnamed protein product [Trichobilharzia regenti]